MSYCNIPTIKIKLLIFVFVVRVNITYSLTQLNTSGFVRHLLYYIYLDQRLFKERSN